MNATAVNEAYQYITRIRNDEKRRYARNLAASYYIAGAERPDPKDYQLGTMAEQAVRLNIAKILGPRGTAAT